MSQAKLAILAGVGAFPLAELKGKARRPFELAKTLGRFRRPDSNFRCQRVAIYDRHLGVQRSNGRCQLIGG